MIYVGDIHSTHPDFPHFQWCQLSAPLENLSELRQAMTLLNIPYMEWMQSDCNDMLYYPLSLEKRKKAILYGAKALHDDDLREKCKGKLSRWEQGKYKKEIELRNIAISVLSNLDASSPQLATGYGPWKSQEEKAMSWAEKERLRAQGTYVHISNYEKNREKWIKARIPLETGLTNDLLIVSMQHCSSYCQHGDTPRWLQERNEACIHYIQAHGLGSLWETLKAFLRGFKDDSGMWWCGMCFARYKFMQYGTQLRFCFPGEIENQSVWGRIARFREESEIEAWNRRIEREGNVERIRIVK